jgi:hypothetical protein
MQVFWKPAVDKVRGRLFRSALMGKIEWGGCLSRRNKYNPIYNLQTMMPLWETGKLGPRGNMTNKTDEYSKEGQGLVSAGTQGGFFEIHVRGQLDESWSDWLEGLEVNLLENDEMMLSGRIGDQAALLGVLNKLYGLNLALLSVSEVGQKQ